MPERVHISRFTPSLMLPATLEAIFVQRQDLAVDTVDRVRDAALAGNLHYLLFIGPRGCGKTHFVSLIYHRLNQIADLREPLRIAWLNEDETSTSFLDLQLRVYRALQQRYESEFPLDRLEPFYDLEPAVAARHISELLLRQLGDRKCLVIVENLDSLFAGLDRDGQHDWRSFLQESGRFTVLATAQQLFPAISSRNAPFFGFFHHSYLELLTIDQGLELLGNIARQQRDIELTRFLQTPRGRARVRALQHLSGGNHRVYVVLSEFITRESLDELVGPFEKMLDELTPYYQERLRWLSPLQRKIVEHLCAAGRPVAVKEIARGLFASNQSIARQLKELKAKRYVDSKPRGRESLYELTEPLMRMSLELKEHRGGPIRLIVEFLRIWYSRDELDSRLRTVPATARLERLHIEAALQSVEPDPCLTALLHDLEHQDDDASPEQSLPLLEELVATRGEPLDWFRLAQARLNTGDLGGAIADFTAVIGVSEAPVELVAWALFARGCARGALGDSALEFDDYTAAIELRSAPVEVVASALVVRGSTQNDAGDYAAAILDLTAGIALNALAPDVLAGAHLARGNALAELGDFSSAEDDLTTALELQALPVAMVAKVLRRRGQLRSRSGDSAGAIADFTSVTTLDEVPIDEAAFAHLQRGFARQQSGDAESATSDYSAVIGLANAPNDVVSMALWMRGYTNGALGRLNEALCDVSAAIDANPENAFACFFRCLPLLAMGRWEEGWTALRTALRRFSGTPDVHRGDVPNFLRVILWSSTEPAAWTDRLASLVSAYADFNELAHVGNGLVNSLRDLADGSLSHQSLHAWRATIHAVADSYPDLCVALRLFDVGIDYLVSGDARTLLDLPSEQREILTQVFNLDDESAAIESSDSVE
jgi:tetratricopeptide (TPR) repeat protein